MADPVTLMTLVAVGSVISAAGAAYTGVAGYQMNKYQAGVAQVNEKIAKQNADYAREVGEEKAEQAGMKSRQDFGKIVAAQGASGFRSDSGSTKDIQESQTMLGRSNQDIIRANAARAAYGHEVEAINFGAQSDLYSMAAEKSLVSGGINTASSIIGGATNVSDKWLQYNQYFDT